MARITPSLEHGKISRFVADDPNIIAHGSTEFIVIRGKPEVTDTDFAYYLTRWDYVRQYAISQMTGSSGRQRVPINSLQYIDVTIPPLPRQRAIAGILGALDDKIELNRRMNRTLESIARAVYDNLVRQAGDNAKIGTVGEEFDLTMGQSPPGSSYNEEGNGIPFFQGRADFGFRYPENRVYCTAPTRFAQAGDTLVCVRAPVGDVNMANEVCAIGRGIAAIRHKTGSRSYTYYAMKSLETDFARFEAEGTVFGSINKVDFHNLIIAMPREEQVEQFEQTCYSIDQMIENNEKETKTLVSLRDTLLPKLMSGAVSVKVENERGIL
jgi:type I restriction enzyme S subunit